MEPFVNQLRPDPIYVSGAKLMDWAGFGNGCRGRLWQHCSIHLPVRHPVITAPTSTPIVGRTRVTSFRCVLHVVAVSFFYSASIRFQSTFHENGMFRVVTYYNWRIVDLFELIINLIIILNINLLLFIGIGEYKLNNWRMIQGWFEMYRRVPANSVKRFLIQTK